MTTGIRTLHGSHTHLHEEIDHLAGRLEGTIVTPQDSGYDDARRLWNGIIDHRPALIIRCADHHDVAEAVRFAAHHHLLVAVRGGGHNVSGTAGCDGGMVIDLSGLRHVEVDPDARTVRAGGGATWADVDTATQRHGLATPGGVVSDTGIGGLTLGGGIGWLRRKYGLSCDNLIGADVVTADGETVRASDEENPNLMWALRGGGGNFGVVTSFEYRLHPVGPEVMAAIVFHHGGRMGEGLRFYREFTTDLTDDISSFALCGTVPSDETFPEDSWGEPFLAFVGVHTGSVDEGRRLLQPLRDFADPIVDLSEPMPYVDVQQAFDEEYPTGMRYYWKSLDLPSLSDGAIEEIAARAVAAPSPLTTLDVWHQGGAMGRVAPDATAFGDRSASYLLGAEANWEDPGDDDVNIAWARDCVNALQPYSSGREYLNFPGFMEDAEATLRTAHGVNYQRLVEVKRRYDPTNLFRLHQNISPDTEPS